MDLVRSIRLELPRDELELYRKDISDGNFFVFSLVGHERADIKLQIRKWYFPHPRKEKGYAWRKGPGFSIPGADLAYWVDGVDRLTAIRSPHFERFAGLFVYQIKYGKIKEDGHPFSNVRFFVESKGGLWNYQIQNFQQRESGTWHRTQQILYWPYNDVVTTCALVSALSRAKQLYDEVLMPAPDCRSVEGESIFEED